MSYRRIVALGGLSVAIAMMVVSAPKASSHREAPGITKTPKVDGTDLYMFRSYEPGREQFVTVLANYMPLQDPAGGPNFYMFDEDAVYDIHLDNNGDAKEDLTFRFRFRNDRKDLTVPVNGRNIAIPLINLGRIGPDPNDTAALNVIESYSLKLIRGSGSYAHGGLVEDGLTGEHRFLKPVDRIGDKSIRDDSNPLGSVPPNDVYESYANNHIYAIDIPGCATDGRVFVGQRREGFVINVGEVLDLVNTNPIGPRDGEENNLAGKSVSTLALELPISCITRRGQPIVGAWTTASVLSDDDRDHHRRKNGNHNSKADSGGDHDRGHADCDDDRHDLRQVSRLGNPLVNEVVIGLKDKDRFNRSHPRGDLQFLKYVTHPTLPVILNALFGVTPPSGLRTDLVQVFLTGVPGLTMPPNVRPGEMLRLNTSTAVALADAQNSLGVLGGDPAGFPNGRRPGDDVVDIELRAVMGALLTPAQAPSGQLPYTDGALVTATVTMSVGGEANCTPVGPQCSRLFRDSFPYLTTPLSSSPNPLHQ